MTSRCQCLVAGHFHYNAPMLELGVTTLLAYLLGSLIGSLIVGRLRGGVDIRNAGSGNPGGTNALRTQGAAFALWVVLIDAGKGWIAVAVLPDLRLPFVGIDPAIDRLWLTVACGAAVVVGHVYPVWYGFRGGKGAATLVGAHRSNIERMRAGTEHRAQRLWLLRKR